MERHELFDVHYRIRGHLQPQTEYGDRPFGEMIFSLKISAIFTRQAWTVAALEV